nr:MAG TPA: hypothetical protein [Bacteriophage sp.]
MIDIKNEIQKGDKVRWKSQAMGIEKEKIGVVLNVIPSGVNAKQFIPFCTKKSHIKFDTAISRNDRALVAVAAGKDGNIRHYYTPRLGVLEPIEGQN